jgi:hypothetical protein
MKNAPFCGYHWCNEQGSLTLYQNELVISGRNHSEDWEEIEFETFLGREFPELLRLYRWNQKKRRFQKYLKGIFSSFKSFLRV